MILFGEINLQFTKDELEQSLADLKSKDCAPTQKGTPMELSEREKKLLDAARGIVRYIGGSGDPPFHRLVQAVRAYDPPVKKYTMLPFEEFVQTLPPRYEKLRYNGGTQYYDTTTGTVIYRETYDAIREATAITEPKD